MCCFVVFVRAYYRELKKPRAAARERLTVDHGDDFKGGQSETRNGGRKVAAVPLLERAGGPDSV